MIPAAPKPAKGTHTRLKGKRKRLQAKADKVVYRAVVARDGGVCASCGAFGVQLHHVRFRSLGGKTAPENLKSLCLKCHTKAHGLR